MQSGLLRLSRYDLKFIQNLQSIVLRKEKITSNQVTLFNKVVDKYQKQLQKHNITKSTIDSLVWDTEIIDSDPEHTQAYLSIIENLILFKSPFNKKFLEAISKPGHNNFVWIKERKRYESPYSTTALKFIVELAKKHFGDVNYCPEISRLLNTLTPYCDVKYWSPSFVRHHDGYLLVAMNSHLGDVTKNLVLDGSVNCLIELSRYGITVDSAITDENPFLKFASTYMVDLDIAKIDEFVEYMLALNTDGVFISDNIGLLPAQRKTVVSKLLESNIHIDTRNEMIVSARIEGYSRPVLISKSYPHVRYTHPNFIKVIKLKNSHPVNIR